MGEDDTKFYTPEEKYILVMLETNPLGLPFTKAQPGKSWSSEQKQMVSVRLIRGSPERCWRKWTWA